MLRRTPLRSMSAKRLKRLESRNEPKVEREPRPLARAERAGVYAGTTAGPAPKERVIASAAYETAVRALGYCVRCGRVCRPQFCHADQGKGAGIKTDVRRGWAGCGPDFANNLPGCHYIVGTSGQLPKAERRAEEDRLAELTRAELVRRGTWPKSVPMWEQ